MNEKEKDNTEQVDNKEVVPQAETVKARAPSQFSVSLGKWIHKHKDLPDSFPGYTGYQYARSVAAGVPYGISMAATWLGMSKLAKAGEAIAKAGEAAGSPLKAGIGTHIHKFASFRPVVASAMIGTSFTLYRGTSKLGKWTKQHLFDKNDSEEQTIEKLQHYPTDLKNKFREVSPAEWSSTPVAAVVLGFMTSAFDPSKVPAELKWTSANFHKARQEGRALTLLRDVILHSEAKFLPHAAINTIAYSLFFELGDRLYKDKQIERGIWTNDPNSLGGKGSAYPSVQKEKQEKEDHQPDHHGAVDKPTEIDKTYGFFTNEPSIGRFMFRRVFPTALSISAYTAFKFRHAYMLLGDFPELGKDGKPALKTIRDVPKSAWREGAAVTLFFLIPWITEPWTKFYDNFFEKLEKKARGEPLDNDIPATPATKEQIEKNNEKLLDQLKDKDRAIA